MLINKLIHILSSWIARNVCVSAWVHANGLVCLLIHFWIKIISLHRYLKKEINLEMYNMFGKNGNEHFGMKTIIL